MAGSRGGSRRRSGLAAGVLAVALAAAPSTAAQQAPPAESLTLEQATARAMESHPTVVAATGAVRTAAAAERSALGAYLPSLSLSAGSLVAGSSQSDTQTGAALGGARDSYSGGVSASWSVYTGGRRSAERAQADAQALSADAQLAESRYGVALEVERAFYGELRAEELVAVAEARVGRAEQGVEAAQRREKVGSATRSDVLRAQLELNTAREALLTARTDENTAAFELGRVIGLDGPADAETETEIQVRPLALSDESLLELLAEESPSIQAAQAGVHAADAGVDAARTQYFPSLNLSTGYDWSNQDFGFDDGSTGWSVRLGFSLPIFDGFQRAETVERARVQEQVAAAQLADAKRGIRASAERALGQLRLAEERITLAAEAVAVAEEDLRVQQQRYELGASTILDLLASQTGLVEAENGLIGARYDYQLARAELEALAGREL